MEEGEGGQCQAPKSSRGKVEGRSQYYSGTEELLKVGRIVLVLEEGLREERSDWLLSRIDYMVPPHYFVDDLDAVAAVLEEVHRSLSVGHKHSVKMLFQFERGDRL